MVMVAVVVSITGGSAAVDMTTCPADTAVRLRLSFTRISSAALAPLSEAKQLSSSSCRLMSRDWGT